MANIDMSVWTGRDDTPVEGPDALRWWQCVKPYTPDAEPGIVLIGFACDEGVRRNGGRVGAKDGPRAIRRALANMAWQMCFAKAVYEVGDIRCDGDNLEEAQRRLADSVERVLMAGHHPIVLGGGHETAWGTFQGLSRYRPNDSIGIINIDAHFDLRSDEQANSGTPFRQMAEYCRERKMPFRYLCLGTATHSNTKALFRKAIHLQAEWLIDICFYGKTMGEVIDKIGSFTESVDCVYLSVDLDVLQSATMPAVSATAVRGISLEMLEQTLFAIMGTQKTAAVDLVELNPTYDIDNQSARVAAYLSHVIASNWRPNNPHE